MAMENYQLDLAHIKRLQRKYIGSHGWTMNTNDKNIETIKVVREFKEYENSQFLLQQDNTDKSIISDGNDVHIINMQTGETQETLFGHTDLIHCGTTTDYRNILATGSNDKTIKLWNTKNGQCLQTLDDHTHYVTNIAAKGNTLFSADWEPCLKLWDIANGQCTLTKPFVTRSLIDNDYKPNKPMSLMIHNNLLYIGATTGKITTIDFRIPRVIQYWIAHAISVNCLTPGKNNHSFYSGSSDQTIKQWDTRNLSAPTTTLHTKNNPDKANYHIQNVYEDQSGTKIFSSDKNTIYVWDISQEKPQLMRTKSFERHIIPNCMHMNNNETELYIGTKEGIKTLTPALNFEQLAALAEQK
jgi:WD40 repeat protein